MTHTLTQAKSHTPGYQPPARRRSAPVRNGPTPRSRAAFDISRIPITPAVQAKLTISQPGDKHEREADQVADRIMSMPEPQVQRMCTGCEEEQGQKVQRQVEPEEEEEKPAPKLIQREAMPDEDEEDEKETVDAKAQPGQTPQASPEVASRIGALRGGGSPLPDSTRAFFEPRFGRDFSNVRIHTDSRAAKAAVAVSARAFTVGPDIYFASGGYRPHNLSGDRLLAHELTHVVQQGFATPMFQRQATDASNELISERGAAPTNDIAAQVADEADKGTRRAIEVIEKALKAADEALAVKEFPNDKLARIRIQATKLRPMLEAYQKVDRGEPTDPALTLDFDPKRDEIDEGDADVLAQGDLEDSGSAVAASPQVFASRTKHGLVSLRVEGVYVQRFICGGLCIGGAIALGALLLSGCSKKKKCIHPVNFKSTLVAKNLDFGMRMRVNWESPTGKLSDLSACHVTEEIIYSKIKNPPFGSAAGGTLPESEQTQRIPPGTGIPATGGLATDTHRHPRSLVRIPPSADSYTVTQAYDYNCPACGGGWVTAANYIVTYRIYSSGGSWKFKSRKTGHDGPFESDEAI